MDDDDAPFDYEAVRDTIADEQPKKSHVERRLQAIPGIYGRIRDRSLKEFMEVMPHNAPVAARLWTFMQEELEDNPEADITPGFLVEKMGDRLRDG